MNTPFFLRLLVVCIFPVLVPPSIAEEEAETKPLTERQMERLVQRNKRKAAEAWARDEKQHSRKEFAQLESDYQEINAKYREPDIKEIIKPFLAKYKKGNRVGCATLYLAQKSSGDERQKLLETAVKDFSDCYYLDGCCVGGLARLYLASHYKGAGDDAKAEMIIGEIRQDYADAQDHSGRRIVELLDELENESR